MSIKEQFLKEFQGKYTVIPLALHRRIRTIIATHHLSDELGNDLSDVVASLSVREAKTFSEWLEAELAKI